MNKILLITGGTNGPDMFNIIFNELKQELIKYKYELEAICFDEKAASRFKHNCLIMKADETLKYIFLHKPDFKLIINESSGKFA